MNRWHLLVFVLATLISASFAMRKQGVAVKGLLKCGVVPANYTKDGNLFTFGAEYVLEQASHERLLFPAYYRVANIYEISRYINETGSIYKFKVGLALNRNNMKVADMFFTLWCSHSGERKVLHYLVGVDGWANLWVGRVRNTNTEHEFEEEYPEPEEELESNPDEEETEHDFEEEDQELDEETCFEELDYEFEEIEEQTPTNPEEALEETLPTPEEEPEEAREHAEESEEVVVPPVEEFEETPPQIPDEGEFVEEGNTTPSEESVEDGEGVVIPPIEEVEEANSEPPVFEYEESGSIEVTEEGAIEDIITQTPESEESFTVPPVAEQEESQGADVVGEEEDNFLNKN